MTGRFPRIRMAAREAVPATLLLRGVRLLDPRAGLDGVHDLLVRDGEIAEITAPGAANAPARCEQVEAEGLTAFPGFVDPHVHLRTPGREDEEDLESGVVVRMAVLYELLTGGGDPGAGGTRTSLHAATEPQPA